MTTVCVRRLGHRWFWQWFLACSAPSHHLHRCQLVVNCKVRNDFPCNMREKWWVFLLYEIIGRMSSVKWRHLYRPQCAKWIISYHPQITLRRDYHVRKYYILLMYREHTLGKNKYHNVSYLNLVCFSDVKLLHTQKIQIVVRNTFP